MTPLFISQATSWILPYLLRTYGDIPAPHPWIPMLQEKEIVKVMN